MQQVSSIFLATLKKDRAGVKIFMQPVSRLLDSVLVLFGVALLTFLLVRLDFQINQIQPFIPISTFIVCALVLFIKPLRQLLSWIGLFVALYSLFYPLASIFPSLQGPLPDNLPSKVWQTLILPAIWVLLQMAYLLRSYLSPEKILLKALGAYGVLLLSVWSGSAFVAHLEKSANTIQIMQRGCSLNACTLFQKKFFINPQQTTSKQWQDELIVALNNWLSWKIKFDPPILIKAADPLADLRLNPSVHPEALERESKRLGLDQPVWKQFLLWLDGILVRGDFGLTHQGEPVIDAIKIPLRNTLLLNLLVLLCTWLIAIPLGVLAAINKGKLTDRLLLSLSSISITTPTFLLSIFVLSLAVKFSIGQVGGLSSANFDELSFSGKIVDIFNHLLLPVSILTFVSIGGLIRQMRGNLLDVLNEDYIKAARARGISEGRIFWGHALQNAINPLITLLGFEFASLVSGAALMEMILAYPGIGALTIEAARKPDINLLMFNLLLGTIMLMLGNWFADSLLRKLDPRIKH